MRAFSILVACLVLSMEGLAFAQSAPSPVRTLFVPVTPCRVADTSWDEGQLGGPNLSAGETRQIPILLSPCGIPADAVAYSMNITVKPDGILGFLTAWAASEDLPLAATMNSTKGEIKSSTAIVPAGVGGDINVFASDATAATIDINGYFTATAQGYAFYPMAPCGMVGRQPLAGGSSLRTWRAMFCEVSPAGAAYSLYVGAFQQTGDRGSITLWANGQPKPLPSIAASAAEHYSQGAAVVPLGTDYYDDGVPGFSISVTDDMLVDVAISGYFAPPSPGGLSFYPLRPCRIEDTRYRSGFTPQEGQSTFDVDATSKTCGVPDVAEALAVNVTLVPQSDHPYLRIPATSEPPAEGWYLYSFGSALENNQTLLRAPRGAFTVQTDGAAHVVIDVTGYFAP
jgi:hypothetical protein